MLRRELTDIVRKHQMELGIWSEVEYVEENRVSCRVLVAEISTERTPDFERNSPIEETFSQVLIVKVGARITEDEIYEPALK